MTTPAVDPAAFDAPVRSGAFELLGVADRDRVLALFAALEQSRLPLPAAEMPGDPVMVAALADIAHRAGRVVVPVGPATAPTGWTTAYANDITDSLLAADIGILPPEQRMVLTVVLLLCVAEPTARGQRPDPWSAARPIQRARLNACQIPDSHITPALAQLHLAGLVVNGRKSGVRPGPALDRLTVAQRSRVELALLGLAAPDDPVIRRIIARNNDRSGAIR